MDLLLVLRVLTLAGRCATVAAILYIVLARGLERMSPERSGWAIVGGRYATVLATTVLIELVWLIKAVAPDSTLYELGRRIYNPAYLLNATVDAVMPFSLVALFAVPRAIRRISAAAVGAVLVFAVIAAMAGALREWTDLMTWTQVIGFVGISGYLIYFALLLLGYLKRVSPHLTGVVLVAGGFAILMPVQAEFFEMVGPAGAWNIWHLNQFLQLVKVVVELAIAWAYLAWARSAGPDPLSPRTAGAAF